MNGDGKPPIILTGAIWEELPWGEVAPVVDCATLEDYKALPEWLIIGGERFNRFKWYPDLQRAAYQSWDKLVATMKELLCSCQESVRPVLNGAPQGSR